MKTILVRKFKTRNLIVRPDQRNYVKELMLDLESDVSFNKEDKLKYQVIDDGYVEIKDIKHNLDENIREILVESKIIEAQTEQEFLSELQPYRDKGWYEN